MMSVATVRADHSTLDLPHFQESDQEGSRHIDHVGGLSGGELGVSGNQEDALSGRHVVQDADQEVHGLPRKGDRLTVLPINQPYGRALT